MSVKRLLVEVDTSTVNVSEFCATHGVSRTYFYKLRNRFRDQGAAGLEPRSRAPIQVANKTPTEIEDQIVRLRKELADTGLDAGAETIRWHLKTDSSLTVPSTSTIWRILKRRGFIIDDPSKKPLSAYKSFEAGRANEMWQIDGTTVELADRSPAKVINVIDDGSRLWIAGVAAPTETTAAAWQALCVGGDAWGFPARVLSDNGRAFTPLEKSLAALGISVSHSRPYHPQTCGKVERFHQTFKKWLSKQDTPTTIDELQDLINAFTEIYNYQRPHRSIGRRTPASMFNDMPKAGPADKPLDTDTSIFKGTVAANGLVSAGGDHLISVGNKHAHQPTTAIVTGTACHVFINGRLIRSLTINPNKRVQPLHPRPGRPTT